MLKGRKAQTQDDRTTWLEDKQKRNRETGKNRERKGRVK